MGKWSEFNRKFNMTGEDWKEWHAKNTNTKMDVISIAKNVDAPYPRARR